MNKQFQVPVKFELEGTVNVNDCLEGMLKNLGLTTHFNGYLTVRNNTLYEVYDSSVYGTPVETVRFVTGDKLKISAYNHIKELQDIFAHLED